MLYHLWSYDKFKCLHWSAGRQPGAFKRVMTVRSSSMTYGVRLTPVQYSYLGSVPLFVIYSVATTVIKFQEGMCLRQLLCSSSFLNLFYRICRQP